MSKNILIALGCLVVGFFIGFFVSNNLNRNAGLPPGVAQNNLPLGSQQPVASVKEPTGAMMSDVSDTLNKAKDEPQNFEAQMKAGELYLQIQNSAKAAPYFDAAAALKPTDHEKIVRLGNAFFDIRQFEKAEPFYQQALEKKPNDVAVRTDLGITFLERQTPDYDRAIKEFEVSIKQDPKHEPTLYNMALAHHRKGDAQNAQKYLLQLEQANPNSPLVKRLREVIGTK